MSSMDPKLPRGILFDLDGVLYNDSELIPGAVETVQWVLDHRIPYLFVTNTTSHSRVALVDMLTRLGVVASESEILTPAVAAAEWLRSQSAAEIALFVRASARPEFAGLSCLPEHAEHGAAYVVVGDLGEQWDYRTLNRAFTPPPQPARTSDRVGHDPLLARSRRPLAGCRTLRGCAGTRHRAPGAGVREARSAVLSSGSRTAGSAGRAGSHDW